MQRPIGVRLSTVFLALAILFTLPLYLSGPLANRINGLGSMTAYTLQSILFVIIGLLAIAGIAAVLWFYFHGHGWARWPVAFLCLLCFFPALRLVFHVSETPMRIFIFAFRAATALLTLLSMITPSSQAWFASDPDAYLDDPRAE